MANPINSDDFVPVIDNLFFDLQPGATFITESPDGSEVDTFVVTRETKVIDGVVCHVIHDTAIVDGEVVEKTNDYFAQDKAGNVWYFGEDTKEFENGKVVSTEGTWRAGVDGAQPGIIMLAAPHVGDSYDQENAPGVAEDHAKVLSVNEAVTVPYGTFDHVLVTEETSPLTPDEIEWKHYAAGVGFLLTKDGASPHDDLEQLVKIKVDGTSHADKLYGYAGGDEVNGNGGNDRLDGWLGADTVSGGSGNDVIDGGGKIRFDGGDDHAADFLYGGSGRDTILVGAADHASGGSGNDLMHLLDNTKFGAIDGGSQASSNVGHNAGDVLQFDGILDLNSPGLSERITGMETLSMHDGKGNDSLVLSAQDVLDLGSGTFDPHLGPHDGFNRGDAVRVNGDHGDKLSLSGNWTALDPSNGADGFDVFACHAPTGNGNVYALVQEDIAVTIAATA
jgi:Ca2+-binding RTX toxin-like protein